jgi:hypothetical protein
MNSCVSRDTNKSDGTLTMPPVPIRPWQLIKTRKTSVLSNEVEVRVLDNRLGDVGREVIWRRSFKSSNYGAAVLQMRVDKFSRTLQFGHKLPLVKI